MLKTLKIFETSKCVQNVEVKAQFASEDGSYYFKIRVLLKDGSFVNITEYCEGLPMKNKDYSYHWQLDDGKFFRWDNSPHHRHLKTFPHHMHVNENSIVESEEMDVAQVLTFIENHSSS